MSDKAKLLLAYITLIGVMLWLAACNPSKKAARIFDQHPDKAAKYCAEKFPVKDDTLYLQGGVIVDTIIEVKDSLVRVICPKSDTVTEVKQVVRFRTVTVDKLRVDTVTVIRENKANTAYLESEVVKYKGLSEKWKDKAQSRGQLIMLLIVILLLIIILQVVKSRFKLF